MRIVYSMIAMFCFGFGVAALRDAAYWYKWRGDYGFHAVVGVLYILIACIPAYLAVLCRP